MAGGKAQAPSTALNRLPDDWEPPTWGLELLTGTADFWANWGYVDGWNWVVGGGLTEQEWKEYDCRTAALHRRGKRAGRAFVGGTARLVVSFTEGWKKGVRAAIHRKGMRPPDRGDR